MTTVAGVLKQWDVSIGMVFDVNVLNPRISFESLQR